MDINHPQWEDYQQRFEALAEKACQVPKENSELPQAERFLCLYGENGLSPEDEFAMLDRLDALPEGQLKKIEVDTPIWQDTVLFV